MKLTTPPPRQIRIARPEDYAAIRALVLDQLSLRWGCFDPTLNPDLNDIGRAYADAQFYVAQLDAKIIGCGALVSENRNSGRVVRMSVATDAQRMGIGSSILERLICVAKELRYRAVLTETVATWTSAVTFYLKHEFVRTEVRDGDQHFVRVLTP